MAQDKEGIAPSQRHQQVLLSVPKLLEDGHTLSEYNIPNEATLHLMISCSGRTESMEIFVKTLTGKTTTVEIQPSDTVLDLKRKIEEQEGIPLDHQRLVLKGRQLLNECILIYYNIQQHSVVHLIAFPFIGTQIPVKWKEIVLVHMSGANVSA